MSVNLRINVLEDLQGNAHALLDCQFRHTYRKMLRLYVAEDFVALQEFEINRAHGEFERLLYGLLAFAQPQLFKRIYINHSDCFGLLSHALRYMYLCPLEVEGANALLDEQLAQN